MSKTQELVLKRKMVNLTNETYERLRGVGSMGESFDAVINRLIDNMERMKGLEK